MCNLSWVGAKGDFTERSKCSIAAPAPVTETATMVHQLLFVLPWSLPRSHHPGKYRYRKPVRPHLRSISPPIHISPGDATSEATSRACGILGVRYRVGLKLSVGVPANNLMHCHRDLETHSLVSDCPESRSSYALSSQLRRLRILCHYRLLRMDEGRRFSIFDPRKPGSGIRPSAPTCYDDMLDSSRSLRTEK